MPLVLLLVGIVLLSTAILGTTSQLVTLLRGDFTGQNNFTVWLIAIAFIGGVGYIPGFRPLANMFFVLLILVILLANQKNGHGGFFAQFMDAVKNTTTNAPATASQAANASPATMQQLNVFPLTVSPVISGSFLNG